MANKNPTRVLGVRVSEEKYDSILKELTEKKLNKTDWLLLQLSLAKKMEKLEPLLLSYLNHSEENIKIGKELYALLIKQV